MQTKITVGLYFSRTRMAAATHQKAASTAENAAMLEPLHAVGNVKRPTTVKTSGSSSVS